jgi:Family of unknown function (DUF5677)
MSEATPPNEITSDTQFAEWLYAKYKEHFDHYYKLHQFAQAALLAHRSFTKDSYHGALQLIAPRAFKSFDSVRRLCEVALCEDAAVVARCLLNLMAVTRWISLDKEKRAKKFMGWYWVELHDRVEKDPQKFSPLASAEIQKRFETEKSQFEFVNKKGKADFARQWYQPEVHSIYDLFKEVDLGPVYEGAYRELSGTEHSDVMAFYSMFAEAEVKDGERKLAVQSYSLVPNYLRAAFQYFADTFGMCNKTLALADEKEFEEIAAAGIIFYRTSSQQKKTPTP